MNKNFMSPESEKIIEQFARAIERFSEALKKEKDEFVRDSAIQRFEFTFELAWKAIKSHLEDSGIVPCLSPKACFREAHKRGLIDYDTLWLDMVKLRNLTAHTYIEQVAEQVYGRLPEVLEAFQKLLASLKNEE